MSGYAQLRDELEQERAKRINQAMQLGKANRDKRLLQVKIKTLTATLGTSRADKAAMRDTLDKLRKAPTPLHTETTDSLMNARRRVETLTNALQSIANNTGADCGQASYCRHSACAASRFASGVAAAALQRPMRQRHPKSHPNDPI